MHQTPHIDARSDQLTVSARDFSYEGELCARVHTLDSLALFDETPLMFQIFDFAPGEENIHVWANKAFLSHTHQTLEEFQSTTLSKCSTTARALQAQVHLKIQVERQTDRVIKALYPKGKTCMFQFCVRPMRLSVSGKERVVILASTIPLSNDSAQRQKSAAEEWSRYTEVIHMIVERDSLEAVAGNLAASTTYGCTSEMYRGRDHRASQRLRLDDIFSACVWKSEEERDKAWKQVTSLSLVDPSLEFERELLPWRANPSGGHDLTQDQTAVWYKFTWMPMVNPQTGNESLMLSQYNISSVKRAQAEVVAAMKAKEVAFASISHDLRTPCHGINGLVDEMLSSPNCPPSVASNLSIVKSCAMRLCILVNDILDTSSLQHSSLVLRKEQCDLGALVNHVLEVVRPLVRGTAVALLNHVGDLPLVECDGNRVVQVIMNLVSNAIKYTEKGTIKISAQLSDRHAGSQSMVTVRVSDTGIGIPPDRIHEVWGAFEQVDKTTTEKYGGTGLGLSLVKALVEAHGGSVGVTSGAAGQPGGTCVSFTLPLLSAPRRDAHTAAKAPPSAGRPGRAHAAAENRASEERGLAAAAGARGRQGRSGSQGAPPAADGAERCSRRPPRLAPARPEASPRAAAASAEATREAGSGAADEEGSWAGRDVWQQHFAHGLQGWAALRGRTVMSVDDDAVNQLVIQNIFAPLGCKVVTCMDGSKALRQLRLPAPPGYEREGGEDEAEEEEEEGWRLPDLILLDNMMPGLSGMEVAREIRRWHSPAELPLVMLSAKQDCMEEALREGCCDCLRKPFARADLLARTALLLAFQSEWQRHTVRRIPRALEPARETRDGAVQTNAEARAAGALTLRAGQSRASTSPGRQAHRRQSGPSKAVGSEETEAERRVTEQRMVMLEQHVLLLQEQVQGERRARNEEEADHADEQQLMGEMVAVLEGRLRRRQAALERAEAAAKDATQQALRLRTAVALAASRRPIPEVDHLLYPGSFPPTVIADSPGPVVI